MYESHTHSLSHSLDIHSSLDRAWDCADSRVRLDPQALENESFRTPVRNPFLGSIPAAIWLVILYFAVGYVKSLIW